ncbi:hypothetical protein TWF173_008729 [Orbilia oligospora]|nr:hypothetical protein TWF173_008729 [Orbilia oligospora]
MPGAYMSRTEKITSLMNVSTNSSAAIPNPDSRPQAQTLEGTPSPAKDNPVAARTVTPSYFYERPPAVQCRLPVDILDGVFPQQRGLFPELPAGAWPDWRNPPRDPNVDIMQYRAAIDNIPAIFHGPNNDMAGGWIWWNGGPDETGRYLTLPGGPDHYDRSWLDIVFDGVPIPGTEPQLFFEGADPYGYQPGPGSYGYPISDPYGYQPGSSSYGYPVSDPYGYQPGPGFYGYPGSDEYYWRGAGGGAGGGFGGNGDSGGVLKRGLVPPRSMRGGKSSPRRRMIRGGGRPVNLP